MDAVLDAQPLLPKALWQLLLWSSHYYQHPLGEVLAHGLPVLLRQGEAAQARPSWLWQLTAEGHQLAPETLARAPRQQQALQLLSSGPLPAAELRDLGIATSYNFVECMLYEVITLR